VGLGLLQGPAELLPVSSSGHLVLVPELLGWPYSRLDPHLRKSFEVALHAGSAAALLIALRGEAREILRTLDARRLWHIALTFAPPAVAGLLLEDAIERRLGTARSVAAAQVAAGLALGLADLRPATRARGDAGSLDFLLIGLGQAAALVPGVSRGGGTVTAARLRGFRRDAASRLSRQAALPIIAGAALLKGVRLAQRGLPARLATPFAAGAAAAFASAFAAARFIPLIDGVPSYLPFAAYRMALGLAGRPSARCDSMAS
jgi:undecaprenyl-diphosphatase